MSTRKFLFAALGAAVTVMCVSCSGSVQDNAAKTTEQAVNYMVSGEADKACALFAFGGVPVEKDSQEHATCVYGVAMDKEAFAPYLDKKLKVNSATIDGDAATVGPEDVNDEFKPLFEQAEVDLVRIDGNWYIDSQG
jgi:hypothetical protein